MNEMCNEPYTRPLKLFPSDDLVIPVRCTFIKDHGANCSWFALKVGDDQALEDLQHVFREAEKRLPKYIQDLVDKIEEGKFDTYLEILLAHLHDRKRFLRGVAGFGRRAG